MTSHPGPIAAAVRYIETGGTTRSRVALRRWAAAHPALAGWTSPAALAATCRSATPADQDELLAALLAVAAGDDLAQLTIVAALSRRLEAMVACWARAGVAADQLAVLEADLVTECWAATAELARVMATGGTCPPRVGLVLVDRAREAVRVPRRRARRQAARHVPLDSIELPGPGSSRPVVEVLAQEVAAAVRTGRISLDAARPVFLTRVAGFDVSEAAARLGCSPAVLRATRSRVERRLAAA